MKKIISILSALALAAAGLVMTGCNDDLVDAIKGPSETWCTMPVTYTYGDDSVDLNVSFYFSESELTSNGTNSGLRTDTTIPAGLTILVTTGATSNNVVKSLTKSTYLLKTYESFDAVEEDVDNVELKSSEDGTAITNMALLWTGLYWTKDDLRKADNKDTAIPAQLQKSTQGTYSAITDLENFSWKTLLKAYLINTL